MPSMNATECGVMEGRRVVADVGVVRHSNARTDATRMVSPTITSPRCVAIKT